MTDDLSATRIVDSGAFVLLAVAARSKSKLAHLPMSGADSLPTFVLHCYALLGALCNGRRLSGFLDQVITVTSEASNQVVGSSNLSGRATSHV